jgi:zeaxanthin glucosyltransferase
VGKVLFLILPAPSHYESCFPLAKNIEAQGHCVTFAGSSSLRNLIELNHFLFFEFLYMPTFEVRTFKGFLGRILVSIFNSKDKKERFREFKYYVNVIFQMMEIVKPDFVFIDEHLSHYFPYIQRTIGHVYIVNTKLPSGKSKLTPPFNSPYIPSNDVFGILICEMIWFWHLLKKRTIRFFTSLAFLGVTNEYFQKREIIKHGFSFEFTDRTSLSDYDNIIKVTSVSLMSELFNFKWRKPKPGELSFHQWNVSTGESLDDKLLNMIRPLGARIIYCGLGTMASKYSKLYIEFLNQLIDAFKLNRKHVLIISTGDKNMVLTLSNKIKNIPEHILLTDFVPQKVLLKHCDLMLTHGGLNSIKECIYSSVPMLGISNHLHKQTDCQGNIARIAHHHIGLRCRITDKSVTILKKVESILSDPSFKENILLLKEKIDSQKTNEIRIPL